MLTYLKAFVAYLKAYVFSKYATAEHEVHDSVVHGSVSALTWSTWAQHDASRRSGTSRRAGTGDWRIALPKFAELPQSVALQEDSGSHG
jgi:hypothetical protein